MSYQHAKHILSVKHQTSPAWRLTGVLVGGIMLLSKLRSVNGSVLGKVHQLYLS